MLLGCFFVHLQDMNLHLILALVYSLKFDESNKVHGQLFRCFDNTIKDLGVLIGNCVRVRSSGLPASYDAIVMMSYFSFFGIAAVVWGVGVGEYMFVCGVYICIEVCMF